VPHMPDIRLAVMREHHNSSIASQPGCKRMLQSKLPQTGGQLQTSRPRLFMLLLGLPAHRDTEASSTRVPLSHPHPRPAMVLGREGLCLATPLVSTTSFSSFAASPNQVHFLPGHSKDKVTDLASAFMHIMVRLHSLPDLTVSHRNALMISKFWSELMSLCSTKPQCPPPVIDTRTTVLST
ncbi:hypothetical protein BDK51DRAFT_20749, partial [Blyttiomyces helicus]